METHNIVSTPNITGNIGSCKTESTSVESGRSFFVIHKTNITTNSCTGEATSYHTWEPSGLAILPLGLLAGIVALWVMIKM